MIEENSLLIEWHDHTENTGQPPHQLERQEKFCFDLRKHVFVTPNRKFHEQEVEQYIGGTQREICDPPIGDGGSASVHVVSNRYIFIQY